MENNNIQLTEDEINEDEQNARITIVNIKILGELKNGVKLNTREKHFALDDVGLLQSLKRLYRVDSRESTYEKIAELVKDVQELFNKPKTLDMDRGEFIKYVIKDLIKAKKGLLSLKDTYHDDKTFTAQIDVEISSLGRLIEKNIGNNNQQIEYNEYNEYNEYTSTTESGATTTPYYNEGGAVDLAVGNSYSSRGGAVDLAVGNSYRGGAVNLNSDGQAVNHDSWNH